MTRCAPSPAAARGTPSSLATARPRLFGDLTLFFIDRGRHPRLLGTLSLTHRRPTAGPQEPCVMPGPSRLGRAQQAAARAVRARIRPALARRVLGRYISDRCSAGTGRYISDRCSAGTYQTGSGESGCTACWAPAYATRTKVWQRVAAARGTAGTRGDAGPGAEGHYFRVWWEGPVPSAAVASVGRVAGRRRSANRDPRPRATRAARGSQRLTYSIAAGLASSSTHIAICNTLYAKIWSLPT